MKRAFSPAPLRGRGRKPLKVNGRKYLAAENWTDHVLFGHKSLAQAGSAQPIKHTAVWPMLIAAVLVPIVMLAQLFNLQVVNGERLSGLAEGNRLREKITYAPRGRILDRYGTELAANTASFQVVAYPYLLPSDETDRNQIYQTLAGVLNIETAEVASALEARGLDYSQAILLRDQVAYDQALVLEQKLPSLPGISLDGVPIRKYLADSSLSHVLGYSGRASEEDLVERPYLLPVDFVGKEGVEATYDELLRGRNGIVHTEVDAAGRPVRILREQPITHGQDVVLTIDAGLQTVLAQAIAEQMPRAQAKRAAGVALDVQTGEVLAMVSLPSFDNNLFADGITQAQYDRLLNDPLEPLYNKAIAGNYPVGSTIKPMHLTGALQEGVVNENTTIIDAGKIVVPSVYDPSVVYTFNGWNPAGLGPMNARRAVAMSSDIYFYTVGGGHQGFRGLGVERLTNYYKQYGFGARTGIDLPGESAGLVPSPAWMEQNHQREWALGDTYNISIGQGDFAGTPLQLAVATNTVITSGKVFKPHVFKQTADGALTKAPEIIRQLSIKPEYFQVAREGMRQVIGGTTSTATFARVPVPVAGKSGTAETDPTRQRKAHAWYTAFAPYDNPRIVFAVILEEGEGGSQFAAPAIARAMEWYFANRR